MNSCSGIHSTVQIRLVVNQAMKIVTSSTSGIFTVGTNLVLTQIENESDLITFVVFHFVWLRISFTRYLQGSALRNEQFGAKPDPIFRVDPLQVLREIDFEGLIFMPRKQ